MYPTFLETGRDPSLFWDLSLGEIKDIIECSLNKELRMAEKEKEALRTKAIMNEVHAIQIAERVACLFSSDVNITPLTSYFPSLFENETNDVSELEIYKAKMDDYAFRHNERLRKAGDS